MIRRILTVFSLLLLLVLLLIPSLTGFFSPNASISLQIVYPGLQFSEPVTFVQAPGDDSTNYVVEKAGKILSFENKNSVGSSSIFLDLSDRIIPTFEDGLLGFAFHPQFSSNQKVYTYHSEPHSLRYGLDCIRCFTSVLSEFLVEDDRIDTDSQRELLAINQTNNFHRGGTIIFGPQGYLWLTIGDSTQSQSAQDLNDLKGSIVRIDVNTQQDGKPYSIPPDNPFVGEDVSEEIYAYGLRNPWRGSFDAKTGDFWVGDVGEDSFEEINKIEAGKNYGWPIMEGTKCRNAADCNTTGLTMPVLAYTHPDDELDTYRKPDDPIGIAVIGGHRYRGQSISNLEGKFLFGDYLGGIYAMDLTEEGEFVDVKFLTKPPELISSIGIDNDGEMYVLGVSLGSIYKIIPSRAWIFYSLWVVYILLVGSVSYRFIKNRRKGREKDVSQ